MRNKIVIAGIPAVSRTLTLNQQSHQSSLILIFMLNQGKWKTVTELVNLIMVQKRPLLDLPVENTGSTPISETPENL